MPKFPFTPAVLDSLPEELAELFRGLELTLLQEICSRLKLADQLNEVTVQDIRALRSHGIDMKDIEKAIREVTGVSQKKLDKLLDDVVERNQAYYRELITLAKVTEPQTLVDEADIAAIRAQCQREFGNLTRSMGFLVDNERTMLTPAKTFQWCCDSALLQVQSGAISYNQAIASAIKQLADSGLIVYTDENGTHPNKVQYEPKNGRRKGHVDQLDVAIRRAVMTGVNQINAKYREQSMDYFETDLVEVSAHLGARNIDGPKGWENHAKWQGKCYRMKEKPRTSTGDYPYLEDACGYGDVTGILGANCRHSFFAFVEGVMERSYTDKELEAMKPENRPKLEYGGKEYDDYQKTQAQRRLEREIRKIKRRKLAFEAAGLKDDATAAGARLRALNKKYKEFSKAAGLPEQRERMRVEYP